MSAVTYIIRRALQALTTVFALSVLVFLSLHMAPGDPALMIAGMDASERLIQEVRERHGLDLPLHVQYARWISRTVQGDFGTSYRTHRPLAADLWSGFRISLMLGTTALLLATLVGVPLGLIAGIRRDTLVDFAVMVLAVVGMSIPGFWLAIMLTLLFSLELGWLPFAGWGSWQHVIMPTIALSLSTIALLARMVRSLIVEVLLEDYVRTARAKGLAEWVVLSKHAFRNALAPVVTVIGLRFGFLVSGTVITETVFSIPGLGRMLVYAVGARDFPVVQAGTLVIVTAVTVINLLIDLTYMVLDPRIRYD